MISVGTKKYEQANHDLNYVETMIVQAGQIQQIKLETQLQNMIATVTLKKSLKLEDIARNLSRTIYEPEQLPGITWHPRDFNATIPHLFFGQDGRGWSQVHV